MPDKVNHKQTRRHFRFLGRKVRKVLLQDWDPIGVQGFPEAEDEYDNYIPQVVKLLIMGKPDGAIIEYLWKVETECMGLAPET